MKLYLLRIWKKNKSFIVFMALMFIFRSAVADWNRVPTGSMKPTILEGDRILVNKMVYDIRLPFSHVVLIKLADPARGDIVVFDSKISGKRLVKRIVGMPGDVVAMKSNMLYINGERLSYINSESETTDKLEDLMGVEHFIRTSPLGSRLSSFNLVKVPEDHYLAFGDNRDNSADSRVTGFIPRNEIVGRSRKALLSPKKRLGRLRCRFADPKFDVSN